MGHDLGIADRLREEFRGDPTVTIVEIHLWQSRGSANFFPEGSVDHHTAGPSAEHGIAPSLGVCINGRRDLPGPLCNLLISRPDANGVTTIFVIAAGRANHAGTGSWGGLFGNSSVYGIERENVGTDAEPFTEAQNEVAARAHTALIRGCSRPRADLVCEHKEWAPKRKIDAKNVSGPRMRDRCAHHLNRPGPTPTPPDPPAPLEDDMARSLVCPNADGRQQTFWLDDAGMLKTCWQNADGTWSDIAGLGGGFVWRELTDARPSGPVGAGGPDRIEVYGLAFVGVPCVIAQKAPNAGFAEAVYIIPGGR